MSIAIQNGEYWSRLIILQTRDIDYNEERASESERCPELAARMRRAKLEGC